MALNQMGLGFVFTARDQASATIQRVGGTFNREANRITMGSNAVQAAMVGLGASVATMAAGAGTLRGAFSIARDAGQMEQGLARVQAVTQATTEDLGRLRDRAIAAGIETQFSPQEAVQGLNELGVRGFQAGESIDALGGVLGFAAGAQTSVAQGAQTVGAALRVFALDADQANLAADRLLRISNLTALQGNELALALGTVSRGAGLTGQNMNEMLIAMGLVRNTGVEASVAASSVSSALIFMTRNAEMIKQRLGVDVTETLADGTVQMRDFADVVLEASTAAGERFPDAAERGALMSQLFGRFGLTAAQAVGQQLRTGVRNASGEIVRGAEALEYMRSTMGDAEGTAEQFRETLQDTFQGQLTLLQGTVQTLRVVLGDAFTVAIRPFVEALTNTLNFFIRVVEAIPGPVRNVIASLVIGIGILLTAFGGLGAIGFAVALILPFLKAIAVTMGLILAATLPVVAAVGAVVAAVVVLAMAYRRNLGGIATFAERIWGRITLGFNALRELFTRGGFSKAISEDLRRAENRGLRRFVINIFAIWHRLRTVFRGIRQGFARVWVQMAPAMEALQAALSRLWGQFRGVGTAVDKNSRGPLSRFMKIGIRIGTVVAKSMIAIVDVITNIVQFGTGMVARWREWQPTISRAFGVLRQGASQLGRVLQMVFALFTQSAERGRQGGSAAENMGSTLTDVLVPALLLAMRALTFLVRGMAFGGFVFVKTVRIFRGAFLTISSMVNRQLGMWRRFKELILSVFDSIIVGASRAINALPAPIRNRLGLGGLVTAAEGREKTRERKATIRERMAEGGPPSPAVAAQPAVAATAAATAAAATPSRGVATAEQAAAAFRATTSAIQATLNQPINVQIDGETIARATRGGARSAGAGEFAPVGVGD